MTLLRCNISPSLFFAGRSAQSRSTEALQLKKGLVAVLCSTSFFYKWKRKCGFQGRQIWVRLGVVVWLAGTSKSPTQPIWSESKLLNYLRISLTTASYRKSITPYAHFCSAMQHPFGKASRLLPVICFLLVG